MDRYFLCKLKSSQRDRAAAGDYRERIAFSMFNFWNESEPCSVELQHRQNN